ncbi:protein tyrosine phosphatase family protein [Pelagimonas sp. KU-00592-HH]|jgi:uncharacterized protein (TIGR01244 family)|uniref:TIGR01244 family sulfur transferase n=1 Tax=Roseobacteraceae TaxID=2854170 RepID=UPI0020CBEDF8|nr:TIGR01244 family sulfur transferase [Shimia sp. CNT1-13L.2]MCP9481652.1 TIGR01244 family sulfur transferase [Shimia sp. CNT1-13L.2]
MDIRQITPRYFVAPQISAEDVAALADAGFTHVICNRPDAEVPPSHQADAIGDAVTAAGLTFVVNPLTHDTMTPDRCALQRKTLEEAPGKVLAYCASGTRSTVCWSLGHADTLTVDEIVNAAAQGGYDMRPLAPRIASLASGG